MAIDRRTFLAASLSALAAAQLAAAKKPFARQLVDTCNGRSLAGVRIRFRNLGTDAKIRLRTDIDGFWDYESLLGSISNPDGEMVEALIRPDSVDGVPYAGMRTTARLWPLGAGGRDNRRALRLSLVPLAQPFGFTFAADPELDQAWPLLITETVFGQDRNPDDAGDKLSYGAAAAWQTGKILMLFGENLKKSEHAFLQEIVPDAVEQLSAGTIRAVDGGVWPAEEIPEMKDDVPAGAMLFVANDDFPRPSVLHRYDSVNPHRIEAAKVTLGNLTLTNLFRKGEGSDEEIELARHLIQRSVAGALGFSPTMALPNRTLLDTTAQISGTVTRTGIRAEDALLSRILYGSGWLIPGARMTAEKDSIINGETT